VDAALAHAIAPRGALSGSMAPRLHVDTPLRAGAEFALPPGAARHVQVLRLQPGAALVLFDGRGGEWTAEIMSMGRSEVRVRVGAHVAVERELPIAVTLALGMPANDRMDTLVEKACELGVAAIQPLVCERSVLRLAGERADKKVAHWQGVAIAACEQCGRTVLPRIEPVRTLTDWLAALPPAGAEHRLLLSLRDAQALPTGLAAAVTALSGPEGGLADAEEAAARNRGFVPVSLGPRVLRADTAPLALLAHLVLGAEGVR
jgi:16S rRNA (uracil1498-N3)-methyltransferase